MELKSRFQGLDIRVKTGGLLALILLTGFVFSGFTASDGVSHQKDNRQKLEAASADLASSGDRASSSGSSERKIVTTIRATIKVGDIETAMQQVKQQAKQKGGFIESSSVDRDRENTGRITVAVPDENLSSFEEQIENNWKIKSRNVDREDVTDSYNELEAEIESLEAEHNRLQQLINQTDDVENLIKLQERLSEVRSRLDHKKQRLDSLKEDVQYSKVHLTLEGPQSFQSRFDIRETFSDAYTGFFDSLKFMIVGAAYLAPFLLVYGIYRLFYRFGEKEV